METGHSQAQQSRVSNPQTGGRPRQQRFSPGSDVLSPTLAPPARGSFAGKGGPQGFSFEGQQSFLSGAPGAGANRNSTLEG